MAVCCCSLAGTAACQHCRNNPFATDVWTNTITTDRIKAKPFGNGVDVCPVCGKPSTISKPQTNADMNNDMMQRMTQKVIDSMPKDSPLLPLIKDGGDAAMVYILMALFFLPGEEMKRIAQEMMKEIKEAGCEE